VGLTCRWGYPSRKKRKWKSRAGRIQHPRILREKNICTHLVKKKKIIITKKERKSAFRLNQSPYPRPVRTRDLSTRAGWPGPSAGSKY
jgi:hypothetical protein